GEHGLDLGLVRLLGRQSEQEPARWVADVDPSWALPAGGEPYLEQAARPQIAVHLRDPAGQTLWFGYRRPHVGDAGVVSVLDMNGRRPFTTRTDPRMRGLDFVWSVVISGSSVVSSRGRSLCGAHPAGVPTLIGTAQPSSRPRPTVRAVGDRHVVVL